MTRWQAVLLLERTTANCAICHITDELFRSVQTAQLVQSERRRLLLNSYNTSVFTYDAHAVLPWSSAVDVTWPLHCRKGFSSAVPIRPWSVRKLGTSKHDKPPMEPKSRWTALHSWRIETGLVDCLQDSPCSHTTNAGWQASMMHCGPGQLHIKFSHPLYY